MQTGGSKLVAVGAKLAANPHPASGSSGTMDHGRMMVQRTRMIWIRTWICLMRKKLGAPGTEMTFMMTMMSHGGLLHQEAPGRHPGRIPLVILRLCALVLHITGEILHVCPPPPSSPALGVARLFFVWGGYPQQYQGDTQDHN